jgi:peptide chain release factor 1
MSQPEVVGDPDKYQELAKQASRLQAVVEAYQRYTDSSTALVDTRTMLKQCEGEDEEMAEMAREEIVELQTAIEVRMHVSA